MPVRSLFFHHCCIKIWSPPSPALYLGVLYGVVLSEVAIGVQHVWWVKVGIGGGPYLVWVTQVLTTGGRKASTTVSELSTLGGFRMGVLDPDGTSHWRVTRYRGTVFPNQTLGALLQCKCPKRGQWVRYPRVASYGYCQVSISVICLLLGFVQVVGDGFESGTRHPKLRDIGWIKIEI